MSKWIVSACITLFVIAVPSRADDSAEIAALITRIEKEEAVFQNFDLTLESHYELLREGAPTTIQKTRRVRRYVEQDGRIYFTETLTGTTVDGKTLAQSGSQAYDGEKTWSSRDGNVRTVPGFATIVERQYPHTLLLGNAFLKGDRLAQYLSSKTAGSGGKVTLTLEGDEQVAGLNCVRLRREIRYPGAIPSEDRRIWLARDRNLIPVKSTVTSGGVSTVEMAQVSSWIDVRPGVWCPRQYEVEVSRIDPKTMRMSKSHRESTEVKEFDPGPVNDPALFREVPKPSP